MAKITIAFSILVFFLIFVTGESSRETPQMCNMFTACTVNITVCDNLCEHRYWGGRGMCATTAPAPIPGGHHRMALRQEAKEPNTMALVQEPKKPTGCKRFKCPCRCLFKKKAKEPCPKNSPPTPSNESAPMA